VRDWTWDTAFLMLRGLDCLSVLNPGEQLQ
jgi:hypothetical protein